MRHFLFDHDDTLLPTFELRARVLADTAACILGQEIDGAAVLDASHGQSLEQICSGLASNDEALAEALVSAYRSRYYVANQQGLIPFDGIPQVLSSLRSRGCRVAVVTSKLGRGARAELDTAGLAAYVECVVGAEDVARPKPDPQPLRIAMSALGVGTEQTVMVGDTSADILGSKAAGVTSVAALWSCRDAPSVLALEPDHAFTDPLQILRLVSR